MPEDPDQIARALGAGSLLVSILALSVARRDVRRKGTAFDIGLQADVTGLVAVTIANPTDADLRVRLTLAGGNSRLGRYAAGPLAMLGHAITPGLEWRTLEQVANVHRGPSSSEEWVVVAPKMHMESVFNLEAAWRPRYVAVIVENGLLGLRRSRFIAMR